jgi:hypothetical protein
MSDLHCPTYYTLNDEFGCAKTYQVPLRLRMVAHAMLERWEARSEVTDVSRSWCVEESPPDGCEVIPCYECGTCGGIVDASGFGPLDCHCVRGDWAGLPHVLSAVMDLRGHTAEQAAALMQDVDPECIQNWVTGRDVPRGDDIARMKQYVQPGRGKPCGTAGGAACGPQTCTGAA